MPVAERRGLRTIACVLLRWGRTGLQAGDGHPRYWACPRKPTDHSCTNSTTTCSCQTAQLRAELQALQYRAAQHAAAPSCHNLRAWPQCTLFCWHRQVAQSVRITLATSVRQTTRRHTPAHLLASRRQTQNNLLTSRRQTPVTCHWKNVVEQGTKSKHNTRKKKGMNQAQGVGTPDLQSFVGGCLVEHLTTLVDWMGEVNTIEESIYNPLLWIFDV